MMNSNSFRQILPFPPSVLPNSSLPWSFHPFNSDALSFNHFFPRTGKFGNPSTLLPPIDMLTDFTRRPTFPPFPQGMVRSYFPRQLQCPASPFLEAEAQYKELKSRYTTANAQDDPAPLFSRLRLPPLIPESSRNTPKSSTGTNENTKLVVKLKTKAVAAIDRFSSPSQNKKEFIPSSESYLGDIQKVKDTQLFFTGKPHQRRNVYKCILRHMTHLVLEEKDQTRGLLLAAGYSEDSIKIAFRTILYYGEKEIKKGTKKVAQKVVGKIVEKKSAFAEILREALSSLLKKWEDGEFGKMYEKSLPVYKEVCCRYLEEVNKILAYKTESKESLN